jgi:two-component system, sensor histidine kinase LadS
MVRGVLVILFYALIFAAECWPVFRVNEGKQTPVAAPFLSCRIVNSGNKSWKSFPVDYVSILPQSEFEGQFKLESTTAGSIILEWPDNKIERLDAFILDHKGDTCAKLQYTDESGYASPLFLKNQVLTLPHPRINEIYEVHYRLYSHNPCYPVCCVQESTSFTARFLKEYTWYGLLAGIVITVFSLNILFFISQRESTYLWYALYTISLGFFHWSYTGVGFQWIWPMFPEWNRYSYMFTSFLLLSFQYIYFYYYTKKLNPVKTIYITGVIVFRLAILSYSLRHPVFSKWHLMLDFLTLAFQVWLMHRILLFKSLHGRLYIASILALATGYLIFIAAYYQWIETNFFTYNTVALGGIFELILGMLALALRFKFLNDEKAKLQRSEIESLKAISKLKEQVLEETREKERIQREVNKDLEIKIQARTVELAQKNQKLEELNNKLLEMSSQLDKQNWTLNKELKVDRLKLMWGKDISFEDFRRTFPSENHIYRFISDLKWQDGFCCKKCSHTEWIEGTNLMSRKCLHCRYEESVTANTLFHGLKFPFEKALYISLHTVIHRDEIPVRQLAQEIDLREATVWAFRKKTLERISEKSNSRGDILRSLVT